MKRVLILVSIPALLVVTGLALVLLFDDAPLTPSAPVCGLSTSTELADAIPGSPSDAKWSIYSYDGTTFAPRILIREKTYTNIPGAGSLKGCDLEIRSLPSPDSRGLDWRIGYLDANLDPLKGKAVRARFYLKSDEAAELGSGSVYIYDGKTVVATTVQRITRNWSEFQVDHLMPADAENFEIWFRLLIDKPAVSPATNNISLAASLEPTDGVALTAKANDYKTAECPLRIGDSLADIKINNPDRWFVYRFESTGLPDISISREAAADTVDGPPEWCTLDVSKAPAEGGRGVDWRMGHIFEVSELRGKTLTFSADIRADRPTKASSGRIYTYDGTTVAETLVTDIGEDWQRYELKVDVSPDAATFQTWLRLVFDDGTIDPANTKILFAPRLDAAR